ncbi:hypothetical protein GUITHDRAFT_147739 [Guillardia theta CCMP2712]|uniref:Nicotinate phosphoribosyltransferase n=3 Tax=Guillardia theta TaxID=55529 RepID=L1ICV1_GUITC|nr:hypothetical protein GUITHDRAFT_147739 [Guillardia theta CCMP2712]EKX33665.1 hypothetical protein GUITHDRAFT_147739 [Guillardia theta CCMP2712]|eukprot:XP_005820645.1 hypothetical protein GUITHDRAFT_147739 [Guillardia theta CCMP2712]
MEEHRPSTEAVNACLTDMYQITMCYAYWKAGRHETPAVFEMYFRKSPFKGQFTLLGGVREVLGLLQTYKFTEEQIRYLREQMPNADASFFDWMQNIDCSQVKVWSFHEGSVVFAREPLLRVEGPIAVCQLLETTLLCLVNYSSLVATNAARMRLAAGPDKVLVEMGLRRAQGPDGGLSASRYSHMGGFDSSSNVLAGLKFGVKISGTHAHAFVQSFSGIEDLQQQEVKAADGSTVNLVDKVMAYRKQLGISKANLGELAAFIAYCQAFPSAFLALVDTYDCLESGIPNFLCCALALIELGYFPIGIRLDSGDLAEMSKSARKLFREIEEKFSIPNFASRLNIVASNDISEDSLHELNDKGHEIDMFGIGTNLVTCQAQPALGCVYKLVAMGSLPRIKISHDLVKVSIPGSKRVFRLFDSTGSPRVDLMMTDDEVKHDGAPKVGEAITCCHPLDASKRISFTPAQVEDVLTCVWDGKILTLVENVDAIRDRAKRELQALPEEHKRRFDPQPYNVSISEKLFKMMHDLWTSEAPTHSSASSS